MNEKNDDLNIIDLLQRKIENNELSKVLKSTIGGYTKKSVQEYLNAKLRQQQTAKETFERNIELLFDEKESIQRNNEFLLDRLNKVESEYDRLFESVKNLKFVNTEFTMLDFINLNNNIKTLENELRKATEENSLLEKKAVDLNIEIKKLNVDIDKLNQELKSLES